MAVGPTLGTGVFIAAGQALAVGGPASLLMSYLFLSLLTYCMATAVAEVAAYTPVHHGAMVGHGYRYGSRTLGFALGFMRWYSLGMLVPYEITTALVNLGLWEPVPKVAIRIAIITSIILGFNFLPERFFRRSEAVFTVLKLLTIFGVLVLSVILCLKDIPGGTTRGFSYWHDPGAMNQYLAKGSRGRFLGLLQSLLSSSVAFIFTPEMIVNRAEEIATSPRRNILSVTRFDSVQMFVLYILSVLASGVVSPSNEPLLINEGGPGLSPFVLGARSANMRDVSAVVTVLILLSSVSSGRSFLFLASRTLCALSESGHAPALFKVRNRWNVPYAAVITSSLFAGLAFLSLARPSFVIFNWLMYFINTSGYLSWLCCCIFYLRFRKVPQAAGVTRPNRSRIQPYGSYFGIVICTLLLVANGFSFAFSANWTASQSIATYAGVLGFLVLFIGHRLIFLAVPHIFQPEEINLERIEPPEDPERTEEQPPARSPFWKRLRALVEGPYGLGLSQAKKATSQA